MIRYLRYLLVAGSIVQIILAAAFLLRLPFAVRLWPLPYTTALSFIFISSIFAAAAISTLCCIVIREDGALAGVALDYVTILVPMTIFVLQLAARRANNQALIAFGIACGIGALFGLGLLLWSRRIPIRDPRPMPRLVYGSFALFIVALLVAGGSLILKRPGILPWSVTAETSVIYGWMFLGAAAYFAYGLLRPSWHNAAGQLAGFLAYDLVLIVPFIQHLSVVQPRLLPNLIIYIVVVSYSGLLAVYYLFVNPATRLWRPVFAAPAAA